MSIILGFDISSFCIGYCALKLDKDKISLLKLDHIMPSKKGSMLDRLIHTRNRISKIIEEIKPDYIGIEDILLFMRHKSKAHTITTLAVFNRMVCMCAYDFLKKPPELFNVMSIRSGIKIKIFPKKIEIPDLVAIHLGITFPYEKDKKGGIKTYNYDRADAAAVALYYSFILSGKVKPKVKVPKSKKLTTIITIPIKIKRKIKK